MKKLFTYLSPVFLFCAALNANAQIPTFTAYECKISFSRDLPTDCPLLQKGDTATFGLTAFAFKAKTDLGNFTFTTTTTSGVPVTGEGTLIASSSGGTFHVTALTIGDPLGDNCSYVDIDLALNAKIFVWYHGNPHAFF